MQNCRHAFYFEKNNCWYCDTSMMPVEEKCQMICFTLPNSKIDNTYDLREKLLDGVLEEDE